MSIFKYMIKISYKYQNNTKTISIIISVSQTYHQVHFEAVVKL